MALRISSYVSRIQEGVVEGVYVVKLSGRINLGEGSAAFRKYFEARLSEGVRFYVLDLTDITFIDSSGIGELSMGAARIRMRSGKVVVVASRSVMDLLQVTKLLSVFDIASSVDDALASFRVTDAPSSKIEFKDQFSIKIEESKGQKTMVVDDQISPEKEVMKYPVREIPPPDRLTIKGMAGVALSSLVILGLLVVGLVWVTKQVASIPLLVLIFCVALLVCICLLGLLLLLSGHVSEKTAEKLFSGVLGKIPGLGTWVPKVAARKSKT
jgi:anti-sigma B factor antagonist